MITNTDALTLPGHFSQAGREVMVAITGDLDGTAFYRYSPARGRGIVSPMGGSPPIAARPLHAAANGHGR